MAVWYVITHFASATRDAVATRHLAIHLVAPKTFYERQYSRGYRFAYRRSRAEKVDMDGWMHCAIGHTMQSQVWAKDSASNGGRALFPLELGWHAGPLLSPQDVGPACDPHEYLALAYQLVRDYDKRGLVAPKIYITSNI